MATDTVQVDYLAAQAGIRASVEGRMTALFTSLVARGGDPATIRDALIGLARQLVAEYGQGAAEFAASWYDDMRLTAGVPGLYTASPYTQDFAVPIEKTVRRAAGGLFGPQPDVASIVGAIVTKVSQYAIDGARNTIVENSFRDPRAFGWQRIPYGATCDFCLMLVGRGGVYRKSTANFRAHANCDCGAAPSWDPDAAEVPDIAYQASSRMTALRARAANGDKSAQRQLKAYRGRVQSYIDDNQGEFAKLRQQYNLTPAESPAF